VKAAAEQNMRFVTCYPGACFDNDGISRGNMSVNFV